MPMRAIFAEASKNKTLFKAVVPTTMTGYLGRLAIEKPKRITKKGQRSGRQYKTVWRLTLRGKAGWGCKRFRLRSRCSGGNSRSCKQLCQSGRKRRRSRESLALASTTDTKMHSASSCAHSLTRPTTLWTPSSVGFAMRADRRESANLGENENDSHGAEGCAFSFAGVRSPRAGLNWGPSNRGTACIRPGSYLAVEG